MNSSESLVKDEPCHMCPPRNRFSCLRKAYRAKGKGKNKGMQQRIQEVNLRGIEIRDGPFETLPQPPRTGDVSEFKFHILKQNMQICNQVKIVKYLVLPMNSVSWFNELLPMQIILLRRIIG